MVLNLTTVRSFQAIAGIMLRQFCSPCHGWFEARRTHPNGHQRARFPDIVDNHAVSGRLVAAATQARRKTRAGRRLSLLVDLRSAGRRSLLAFTELEGVWREARSRGRG
jgi:hypothetical protein